MHFLIAALTVPMILFLAFAGFILANARIKPLWAGSSSPSVYVPGKVRTIQSPYYDTYLVSASGTVNSGGLTKMFGNIQGVGGIGPNITNMQQAFQLSGGESFLLSSFRCVFIGCALADVNAFMINNTVRLIIGTGNFAYADAPAEYWAGGAGAYGGTSAAATNGIPDPRAIVPFDVDPIELTDGVNFHVELIGNSFTAAANFTLRVYLDGQKTQPAQ
jgi:hypothetical protein